MTNALAEAAAAGRTVLAALDAEDCVTAASHVPDALAARLYEETRDRIERWEAPTGPGVDVYLRHDPDMPLMVAEYLANQARKSRTLNPDFGELFGGATSPDAFRRMSPREYVASYLRASDPRVRARRQSAAGADDEENMFINYKPVRTVLGTVLETERLAHVVYRVGWEGPGSPGPLDHVDILTLRRGAESWQVVALELNGLPRNAWFWIGLPDNAKRP